MNKKILKIAVIGAGYVGLANAIALASKNKVKLYDIDEDKINKISSKMCPIDDQLMQENLEKNFENITAESNDEEIYHQADFCIIATPTNYDSDTGNFDTSSIDRTLEKIKYKNSHVKIIIKSTIPIGYTENARKKYKLNISFSPEFLREGAALYDILNASRIVVGDKTETGREIAELYKDISPESPIMLVGAREAESIKLFSNTYLAMRVAYINEIDNYCIAMHLSSKEIIDGISADPRIGFGYNNPSFGYGGYCLPKDTKQLVTNYRNINQVIIKAIVESNECRAKTIAEDINKRSKGLIGVYRLSMKKDSDNYRSSSIFNVMEELNKKQRNLVIYEPMIKESKYENFEIVNDLERFKKMCDFIIANRFEDDLQDVRDKIYTRDIYRVS